MKVDLYSLICAIAYNGEVCEDNRYQAQKDRLVEMGYIERVTLVRLTGKGEAAFEADARPKELTAEQFETEDAS